MYKGFFTPFPTLQTARLDLRLLEPRHAADLFRIRSDSAVGAYLDRPKDQTAADTLLFIEKIQAGIPQGQWVYWGIFPKEEDQVAGTICLWNLSPETATAEVGFELHPDFQGMGWMSEALAAVLSFGFEQMKLHAIEAYVHPQNRPSIRLLEKMGFSFCRQANGSTVYTISESQP